MKNYRKYIEKNRDIFDDKEPSEGHIQRFEALLNKQQEELPAHKPVKKVKLISILSIAASLAVLIAVAIKFYNPTPIQGDTTPAEKNIMSDEFMATNDYYKQQMEEQIADIMCKLANTESENQEQLTEDIQKIIEKNNAFVQEMAKNENPEIALRFLVKHYKTNIQRLESINEKLGKHYKC